MTESKYTDEQIIEALRVRMPHDEICREAYDLIQRQAKALVQVEKIHGIVLNKLDKLEVDIEHSLNVERHNAINELTEAIIKDILPHYPDVSIRLAFEICENAKALKKKEIKLF